MKATKEQLEVENALCREKVKAWNKFEQIFEKADRHDPEELTEALSEAIRRMVEDDDFSSTNMMYRNDHGRQLRVLGTMIEGIAFATENKREFVVFRLKVTT